MEAADQPKRDKPNQQEARKAHEGRPVLMNARIRWQRLANTRGRTTGQASTCLPTANLSLEACAR